jgi:hypothetical protein
VAAVVDGIGAEAVVDGEVAEAEGEGAAADGEVAEASGPEAEEPGGGGPAVVVAGVSSADTEPIEAEVPAGRRPCPLGS